MNINKYLNQMIPPGKPRKNAWRQGIIQIWLTRACDRSCNNCTQASNIRGNPGMISIKNFTIAVKSLKEYFGVVGIFGGNPALHPEFPTICEILEQYIPWERRGIWCNHPKGHGKLMSEIFNPDVSNLNVHQSQEAYDEFKKDWPTSHPFGLDSDSRHAPVFVSMKDVIPSEEERWQLISNCDINRYWSAMIGQFRDQPRAWFCEIAGAQAMLMQHKPDYPDTGLDPSRRYGDLQWWQLPMASFKEQVEQHCHNCGVPLKGTGSLANDLSSPSHSSQYYSQVYQIKGKGQVHTYQPQDTLRTVVDYIGNAQK